MFLQTKAHFKEIPATPPRYMANIFLWNELQYFTGFRIYMGGMTTFCYISASSYYFSLSLSLSVHTHPTKCFAFQDLSSPSTVHACKTCFQCSGIFFSHKKVLWRALKIYLGKEPWFITGELVHQLSVLFSYPTNPARLVGILFPLHPFPWGWCMFPRVSLQLLSPNALVKE